MIYLIDGHNLIGQLPDIDLADPDDEEKLVRKLQGWVRLDRRRRIIVYFDPGRAGGWGELIGGGRVTVHFARLGEIADTLIIKKVKKVRNPQEFTVVSSDRAVLREVKKRRMGYILSQEFAVLLSEARPARAQAENADLEDQDQADAGAAAEVELSPDEVQQWLKRFEKAPRPQRPKPTPTKPVKKSKPSPFSGPPPTADELKEGVGALSEGEVAEWLALFKDKEEDQPAKKQASAEQVTKKQSPKKIRDSKKMAPPVMREDDVGLTAEEVDAWLELFEKRDDSS